MPSIPSFLKGKDRKSVITTSPQTTYYIASSLPSTPSPTLSPALTPIPPPSNRPQQIPSTSLLLSLTHPNPDRSEATSFFLTCLPDPVGFLLHSATFVREQLKTSIEGEGATRWRHQLIDLVLEDKSGLAATSGGRIMVSLQWVGDIMRDVKEGRRDMNGATKEFKGVLIHELVHTIQHDGDHTCPGWFIESLADLIRLNAHLDPPHWRKAGQGKRDKGWEEAYDSGARFMSWLTEGQPSSSNTSPQPVDNPDTELTVSRDPIYLPTTASAPQPTQCPTYLPPPSIPYSPRPTPDRRSGPFPDLVKLFNARLERERWDDGWWEEYTGVRLEGLWTEYLDYYGVD